MSGEISESDVWHVHICVLAALVCAFTYCLFSLAVSEDPPRPPDGSPLCLEMAGYSAARGEFTVEYNNFAEMDICNLTLDAEDKGEDEEDTELVNGELREYS